MVAEIIHRYHPHLIQLHNYYNTNSRKTKESNYELLKKKAFKKLGFYPSDSLINDVIDCKYLAIETFLIQLQKVLENVDVKKPVIKVPVTVREQEIEQRQPRESDRKKISDIKEVVVNDQNELIRELRETIDILESKIKKLNQIVQIKDEKIRILENRLFENGLK